MPEIRYNIITREWVIIATERAKRPEEFAKAGAPRPPRATFVATCPFCPGNEDQTPPEVYRQPAKGPWQVRGVPNKFAALDATGEVKRHHDGLKRSITGVGLHEVIVETPDHSKTLAQLTEKEFARVMEAYLRRYDAVTSDPRVAHATLFKNHGESAGTSLEHTHSQIVGTPIIPPQVRQRMERAMNYFDIVGDCLFCSVMADELLDQARVVTQTNDFVAFIPYAASSPFHVWIYPLQHTANFSETTPEQLADLSRILRTVLRKLYFGLGNPDFNLSLRTPPQEATGLKYYHWYISVIPRVVRVAGFELGSGMFINTSLPEQSAAFLRNAPTEPA